MTKKNAMLLPFSGHPNERSLLVLTANFVDKDFFKKNIVA